MKTHFWIGLLAFTFFCGAATAQQGATGGQDGSVTGGVGNHMMGTLNQDQMNKLGDYMDNAKRLTKQAKEAGKSVEELTAEYKAKATELAKAMPLSCDVTDAIMAAKGPATIDGKTLNTSTYEVACTNGMGYFLVDVDGGKPYGFSCLAAQASYQADVAAKKKDLGTTCTLSANMIPENMASAVMSHAGVNCMVSKINWIGQNAKNKIEYNEVACADNKGYILVTALPGQTIPPQTMTCHDAAMRGITCKLTDAGPVVTKMTFVDALAAHKIPCSASVDNLKLFGMQTAQKRYVVEFYCPAEQPNGLVAFIPAAESKAPFETVDCKAATKKGVVCKLNHQ